MFRSELVTGGGEPTTELRVLGPLQVICDGEELALGTPSSRRRPGVDDGSGR